MWKIFNGFGPFRFQNGSGSYFIVTRIHVIIVRNFDLLWGRVANKGNKHAFFCRNYQLCVCAWHLRKEEMLSVSLLLTFSNWDYPQVPNKRPPRLLIFRIFSRPLHYKADLPSLFFNICRNLKSSDTKLIILLFDFLSILVRTKFGSVFFGLKVCCADDIVRSL